MQQPRSMHGQAPGAPAPARGAPAPTRVTRRGWGRQRRRFPRLGPTPPSPTSSDTDGLGYPWWEYQREEIAALRIQALLRGYLARRRLGEAIIRNLRQQQWIVQLANLAARGQLRH